MERAYIYGDSLLKATVPDEEMRYHFHLPEVMAPYVDRMDFIIGVQAKAPHNCGVLTWNGTAYINCIRSIQEPELELHFYRVLHQLGLPVRVESNQR